MARPRSDIRGRVVRAAREQFLHRGVDGASLRRIARAARTSIGMIYYYFPTKDALFLGVVEESYTPFLAELERALDPSVPVEARIRALYARIGAASREELQVIRLTLREALVSSKRLASVLERFQRGHLPLILAIVGDGLGEGTFDPSLHPAVLILGMMALGGPAQLVRRALEGRLPPGMPEPPGGAELSRLMVRVLLHGVGPGPAHGGES